MEKNEDTKKEHDVTKEGAKKGSDNKAKAGDDKKKSNKKDRSKPKEEIKTKESEHDENPDFKYIVRIATTNLEGEYAVPQGLTGVKGIGIRLGIAITDRLGIPRTKRMGDLTDSEVEKLAAFVEEMNTELPSWMLNRQQDFDTGEDLHIIGSEVQSTLRNDLNLLKMIRCYRGIRHEQGQKVRGQRTRSNGRTGITVGVMRKKIQHQQQKSKSGK